MSFSDPNVLAATLRGHTDSVWCLAYNAAKQRLLTSSSDGTVKLWSPTAASTATEPLVKTFDPTEANGTPTSVDWIRDDPTHMVTAYANAKCIIHDVETGSPLVTLETTTVSYRRLLYLKER